MRLRLSLHRVLSPNVDPLACRRGSSGGLVVQRLVVTALSYRGCLRSCRHGLLWVWTSLSVAHGDVGGVAKLR
jgi:hypothetical protein